MKDDPDFNILFVSLIEKQRSLYDYTCAEYSNRNAQDRAWESISKEVSESGKYLDMHLLTLSDLLHHRNMKKNC